MINSEQMVHEAMQARLKPLATRYAPAVATAHHHSPVCTECYAIGRVNWAVAWGKVLRNDPDPVTWQGYCQKHQEARIEDGRLRLLESENVLVKYGIPVDLNFPTPKIDMIWVGGVLVYDVRPQRSDESDQDYQARITRSKEYGKTE